MKITELLTKNTIHLNIKGTQKLDVVEELVSVLDNAGKLADKAEYRKAIIAREEQSTTGIGEGIAIPHAKTKAVKQAAIAFGRSTGGVNYESLDGQPAHLFFMIAATEGANNTHLEALSRLSTILLNEEVRKQLLAAKTEDEVLDIINKYDQEDEEETQSMTGKSQFIVAVTACPTGIAHTYMAADSLKAKAKEMGVDIKVETNGSGGAKNVLTAEEIENAVAVIVAADKTVEMARFNGKHVIETAVANGIRKPKELIEKALKQDAPIYHGNGSAASSESGNQGRGVGATIYKHLMNGVSNMLPFVVGGGILIAICFMFGFNAFKPDDPTYNPIAEALMTIGGGNAFALMVPVLAGFIAMSIADRPGFAAGMVGGMLANAGGAGFLGGLIAGFLAGYLVVGLKKVLTFMPASLEGIKTILLYPLLGIALTGFIMLFVVNKPVGALNQAISHWLSNLGTGNAVLLGVILGAMMSFDMGGPINKAAYVFGTGLLANGVYEPMAAIMAAGMVPPLGIAIATTIFKKKFSQQDREAGKVNYIMGLSFITEGAIPFAAADPLRVIPSVMAGSAVAGALSMMFHIGLRAPHGGVFVMPLVSGNWLLYLLSVVIGAIVSAVLLGILKKPVTE
ncbi:PTS system D-fructose-specific IIA component (F1P-forming) (Frc family) /PTS system D-fructose-specific IIB component (F1P-forming) (Frc family) /PTS system D-fructose-specific IIC component (F1P-forming) (Frc family) [Neobacillus bataviensis]|uniref:PTS system D-fructose-specific IIA component (F1P-forming) (Frc family) /PTS system D-fructose-specific IIB component (F1P-forming) (Frc family) /PTS system D-fructose-specific IIC component (F1P-f... n=1 Tax=Neobacillus bataviensis TaxID=220685 RepID=A0A561DNQ9_9BACI|nr:PTS fructose transporter subunit IIABC [Neobacillus bataviensis]TWE04994.1 PTS system D-fructose-specific IIA component (F1P-forming) (Frc family) /PTS system D-fructose-specific IIB component (F1P-forming) (Frc family) /PTS system D-fructose-specific IIC component (F1P-forming) (Frc family) [Neobacillus bataviensis]